MTKYTVVAIYRFVTLEDYTALKKPVLAQMLANDIKGTLLLAKEGINGTISGTTEGLESFFTWLESDERFSGIIKKYAKHDAQPFYRTKVKLKKEIVTLGVEGIDPTRDVGEYVKPKDWNALISDPDVLLVDTRNDYEVDIGTFKHAVDPETKTFREFPQYVKENLDKDKHKKVAMFCTGGIRCEKSTAYLKSQGFENVYHLQGGILKYLEEVPEEESLWQGECFVFDERVAVNHSLEKGHYDQCHACRSPITEDEKQDAHYVKGISCPHCYSLTTDEQRKRYEEREKQIELAKERGEDHIGSNMLGLIHERKKAKQALKANNTKKTHKD
jgi:UPF0176 protein